MEALLMGDMLNQHCEHSKFAHKIRLLMKLGVDMALVQGNFDLLYFCCGNGQGNPYSVLFPMLFYGFYFLCCRIPFLVFDVPADKLTLFAYGFGQIQHYSDMNNYKAHYYKQDNK